MTDASDSQAPDRQEKRIFLVVVDDTHEMTVALRFACRRARHTNGHVALLHVIEPSDYQNWLTVGELMREEARSEAEALLQRVAAQVTKEGGRIPILYLREGNSKDALFELLDEEPQISILVLGASTEKGGPGPLVAALTGKDVGKLRIPVTIVPGNLTDEDVDALS